VTEGRVKVGPAPYLDAQISFRSGPLAPFLDALIAQGAVPAWVRGILKVPEVQGTTKLRLEPGTIVLGPLDASAGSYGLQMRMVRHHHESSGTLFARYRSLAMGLGFTGRERHFHLFNAADWYREQGPRSEGP